MDTAPIEPTEPDEDYTTRGRTRLATKTGFNFVSSNPDLPAITPDGVNMTAKQAAEVLVESDRYNGHVFTVENEKEG